MSVSRSVVWLLPIAALSSAVESWRAAPDALTLNQPVADGYVVTQKVTSDAPQSFPLTVHVKASGGKVRVDLESSELTQLGGVYLLLSDSGKIISVMSQMGMAMRMDASAFTASGVGGMAGAPVSISDVSVTVDDLGAGETMFGAATHKYRFRSKYATNSEKRGQLKGEGTIDAWIAPSLAGLSDGLQKFADTFGTAFSGIAGNGSQALASEMKAKIPRGYVMKAVIRLAETDNAGRAETSTTTVEVTDYARTAIDASAFEVPANMQVMDMNQMFRGRGGR